MVAERKNGTRGKSVERKLVIVWPEKRWGGERLTAKPGKGLKKESGGDIVARKYTFRSKMRSRKKKSRRGGHSRKGQRYPHRTGRGEQRDLA